MVLVLGLKSNYEEKISKYNNNNFTFNGIKWEKWKLKYTNF